MAANKCGRGPEINMSLSHSSDSFGYCCIDWYRIGQSSDSSRPSRRRTPTEVNVNIDSPPWKTIIIYYCTKSCVCQNLFLFFVESFQCFVPTFDGCGNSNATTIIHADWHILLLVIVWNVFFDMHKLIEHRENEWVKENETVQFSRSVDHSQVTLLSHTVLPMNMNSIGADQTTSSRMYCISTLRSHTRTSCIHL